jgi:hypothetical protein
MPAVITIASIKPRLRQPQRARCTRACETGQSTREFSSGRIADRSFTPLPTPTLSAHLRGAANALTPKRRPSALPCTPKDTP